MILDVLGTPTLQEFYDIGSRRSREYLRALPFRAKREFETLYPNANPLAIDFLKRTLTFDPKKRMTVEEALAHPYLANYHDPADEPTVPPLDEAFFDFDQRKDEISKDELKELLYNEIMAFHVSVLSVSSQLGMLELRCWDRPHSLLHDLSICSVIPSHSLLLS